MVYLSHEMLLWYVEMAIIANMHWVFVFTRHCAKGAPLTVSAVPRVVAIIVPFYR